MFENIKVIVNNKVEARGVEIALNKVGFKWGNGKAFRSIEGNLPYPHVLFTGENVDIRYKNKITYGSTEYANSQYNFNSIHVSTILKTTPEYFNNKRFVVKTDEEYSAVIEALKLLGKDVYYLPNSMSYYPEQYIRVSENALCYGPEAHAAASFDLEDFPIEPLENLIGPAAETKSITLQDMLDEMEASGDIVAQPIEAVAETNSEIGINPKAANGSAKLPLHIFPASAIAYGCVALVNGGSRYGFGNYKATPVAMSIYLSAMLRHVYALIEGQEFDEVDGTPHLGAILANAAIIIEARSVGTLVDDRPISGGYLKEAAELTAHVNRLQDLYKDRSPRHYTIKDNPK